MGKGMDIALFMVKDATHRCRQGVLRLTLHLSPRAVAHCWAQHCWCLRRYVGNEERGRQKEVI